MLSKLGTVKKVKGSIINSESLHYTLSTSKDIDEVTKTIDNFIKDILNDNEPNTTKYKVEIIINEIGN